MGRVSREKFHPSQTLGVVCGWVEIIEDSIALKDTVVVPLEYWMPRLYHWLEFAQY